MAGNVPNVSRDSFDWSKFYDSVVLQQGVPIADSDWNEANDVLQMSRMMLAKVAMGSLAVSNDGSSSGYQVEEATSTANNFQISSGWALVDGVLVPTTAASPPADHDYEDDTNIICSGTIDAAASLVLTDSDKNWQSFHDLVGCRVKMTSGAESGNTFTITSNPSATTIGCSGGIGSIAPGDTYIIKPPALTTPSGSARTDEVYVMAWYEDINENEDSNIVHPGLGVETSHRRRRAWCVRVAENGTTPSTPSPYSFGVRYLKLAELARLDSDADIETAMITNEVHGSASLDILTSYFSGGSIPWDLVPDADNTRDLGSSTKMWKDLHIKDTVNVNTLNVYGTAGTGGGVDSNLSPKVSGTYSLGSSLYQWDSLYIDGTATIDTLSISSSAGEGVSTDLVPAYDGTRDLGNASYQWQNLYLSGAGYIDELHVTSVDSAVPPAINLTYDIGSSSARWRRLYTGHVLAEPSAATYGTKVVSGITAAIATEMWGGYFAGNGTSTSHGLLAEVTGTQGNGIQAIGAGAYAGIVSTGGAGGNGIEATAGTGAGNGLLATATTGNSVKAVNASTGNGILIEHSGASGYGLQITASAGATGIYSYVASGSAYAIYARTSGTSYALRVMGGGSAPAMYADNSGTAAAAQFVSTGSNAPVVLYPMTDPASPADGGIWVTSGGLLKFRGNGTTYTVATV